MMYNVKNWETGKADACEIIKETELEGYGKMIEVEHPETGRLVVLDADGVQFTTGDWQGIQPTDADEIGEFDWVDENGEDAVMYDGLPHVF